MPRSALALPGAEMGTHRRHSPSAAAESRMIDVRIKRIYDKPERSDGLRILVDRIWPRGVTKRKAAVDDWLRELAPSTGLRKWFGHDPARWAEFRKRYRVELREHALQLKALRRLAARQRITLIYSAKDAHRNQAVVLQAVIRSR